MCYEIHRDVNLQLSSINPVNGFSARKGMRSGPAPSSLPRGAVTGVASATAPLVVYATGCGVAAQPLHGTDVCATGRGGAALPLLRCCSSPTSCSFTCKVARGSMAHTPTGCPLATMETESYAAAQRMSAGSRQHPGVSGLGRVAGMIGVTRGCVAWWAACGCAAATYDNQAETFVY